MPQQYDKIAAFKAAFRQMRRTTALDICDDYREVVARMNRLQENLAGEFVVAGGDEAKAIEAELRMVEEAFDVFTTSLLPEVITDLSPPKKS